MWEYSDQVEIMSDGLHVHGSVNVECKSLSLPVHRLTSLRAYLICLQLPVFVNCTNYN